MRNSNHGRDTAPGLSLKVDVPFSTSKVTGIDLTHIIHTSDHGVSSAKGGGGGGGSGGGGTGTSFAPYTSGAAGAYNITINFTGEWTQAYYDIFVQSADYLSMLIVGDLPNVSVRGARGKITTVDDIVINAELGAIDGLYGILGQAGPTAIRTDSSLPATATMKFDIADVNDMTLEGFADVVLHEMAHSLGFGSIWSNLGLVTNGQFTGEAAVAEYNAMGRTGFIPVEQDGGSGTAGAHWDEETFDNELMTGYINEGFNPFSRMSAAAFDDMGYTMATNYLDLTESYTLV